MPKIPPLKAKRLIALFLKAGFYVRHQSGSHVQLRCLTNHNVRITIPRHDRFDLPPSVINSIIKQAEMTREEFLRLLKD